MFRAEKPATYLFANLAAFSITGGMEKFNRCFMYALQHLQQKGALRADAVSFCDTTANASYFPDNQYAGFNRNRLRFVWNLIGRAKYYDTVILGHVNLAIPGY